jgi:FemAB-related protein (PEP-CTERM system-associated)
MTIKCRHLEAKDEHAWDAFVVAQPQGTFFHRVAWQHVIRDAFHHAPHYLIAERQNVIVGVLPLIHVKTRLFGNALISNPFCVYGGPLSVDAETNAALANEALLLMQKLDARYCELRSRDEAVDGWRIAQPLYETFRKMLPENEDAALKAIPRKQRAVVRKGIERNLKSDLSINSDKFFRLYAESVRNLGTPMFPRRFFRLLLNHFEKDTEILTIVEDNQPLCAVLSFKFRNEILPYYAGGGFAARGRGGHDFMYWEVMRRAVGEGLTMFDFGRSKIGTGAHSFKKNWGFTPLPLHYTHQLASGAILPEHNPLNPKYRMLIAAWKRLPLPLANAIGPHIVRGLG